MERYLVQRAEDAFKELAGDGDWKTRLGNAKSLLTSAEQWLASAPQEVKDAVAEVESASNHPELSTALRRAITAILEEFARQEPT
jgi:hypothetical protein